MKGMDIEAARGKEAVEGGESIHQAAKDSWDGKCRKSSQKLRMRTQTLPPLQFCQKYHHASPSAPETSPA